MPHKDYTGLPPGLTTEDVIKHSSVETIDRALFKWVNDLKLHAETNKGWKQTGVIWVSAERAFQMKNNKEIRDINGVLKLPLITVERTDITKSADKKGMWWANVPAIEGIGGSVVISRRIQQDKTADFTNAQSARKRSGVGTSQINFKTQKKTKPIISVAFAPVPVYIEATYAVTIRTEYQQQMNELVLPFMTKVGPFKQSGNANYFMIRKDGHAYEAFIQESFSQEDNVASMEEDERTYITKIEIKVLGHLLGEGRGADMPTITYRESVVQVKMSEERDILEDKPQHRSGPSVYRGSAFAGAANPLTSTGPSADPAEASSFSSSPAAAAAPLDPRIRNDGIMYIKDE